MWVVVEWNFFVRWFLSSRFSSVILFCLDVSSFWVWMVSFIEAMIETIWWMVEEP